METSYIVFTGVIVAGLFVLPFTLRGMHKLAKDFFRYSDHKEEKFQNEKIDTSKTDLKDIVNSGTLSDLLDATKKLGDEKKKLKK